LLTSKTLKSPHFVGIDTGGTTPLDVTLDGKAKTGMVVIGPPHPAPHELNSNPKLSICGGGVMGEDGFLYCAPSKGSHVIRVDTIALSPFNEYSGPSSPPVHSHLLQQEKMLAESVIIIFAFLFCFVFAYIILHFRTVNSFKTTAKKPQSYGTPGNLNMHLAKRIS